MKKIILIVFFLASCSNPPQIMQQVSETEDDGWTSTHTPLITPATTRTPIRVNIKQRCPSQPLVSLENLGLLPELRLIMLDKDVAQYSWDESNPPLYFASSDNQEPIPLQNITSNDYINFTDYQTSPDGRLIAFMRKEVRSGELELVFSSIDGSKLNSLNLSIGYNLIDWLNDNRILVARSEPPSALAVQPDGSFKDLLAFPEWDIAGLGGKIIVNDSHIYLLYQNEGDFRLFDTILGNDSEVMEWLTLRSPDFGVFVEPNSLGEIRISVMWDYGFDLSQFLKLDEVLISGVYQQIMQPMIFPRNIEHVTPRIFGSQSHGDDFAISSYDEQNLDKGDHFFWFTYEDKTAIDYCFWVHGVPLISPDGRFAAFTDERDRESRIVVVLNLETGERAEIPNYWFVGCGTGSQ